MKKLGIALMVLLLVGGAVTFFVVRKEPLRAVDTQLLALAKANDLGGVKKSLSSGADPNARQAKSQWDEWFGEKTFEEGNSALIYASQWGNLEMMNLLLEKGAKVDLPSEDGVTALMMAAHHLQPDAVKLLLDKGADPTAKSVQGSSVKDAATKRNATPESRRMEQMIVEAMRKKGLKVADARPAQSPG